MDIMYTSTRQVIERMLEQGIAAEKLDTMLQVTKSLLSNHGYVVKTSVFQWHVERVDADVAQCIRFLEGLWMLTLRSLKALLHVLHGHPSYVKNTVTVSTSHPEMILKALEKEKQEGIQLDVERMAEIGVKIERQGKIYKRNLSSDLTSLFSTVS